MRGSAGKKTVARCARVCNAGEFCVGGSAFFPLKGAAWTDYNESNGISLTGNLWERLGADGGALCEGNETIEKKKERFHDSK